MLSLSHMKVILKIWHQSVSELRNKNNTTVLLVTVTERIYVVPGTLRAGPYFIDRKFETRD